jgi:nucleotide-binding universal stress UspA family protein
MKRIVVPLDGSTLSEAIVPVVEALARDYEAEIVLVRALVPQRVADGEFGAQQEAEAYLCSLADAVKARGSAAVDWKIWYDDPAPAIVSAATASDADLVAMATHGRGGLGRLLLGSVAEAVVRTAAMPVLLVRGEPASRPGGLGQIVVPLDGSEVSEAVLPAVAALAGPFDLGVHLVHAVETLPVAARAEVLPAVEQHSIESRRHDAEDRLAKVAAPLAAKGLRVTPVVRVGTPVDVIAGYAQETDAGLIAMATHGRTGLGRLLMGSVAERVLRSVRIPMLLWKPPAAPSSAYRPR